MPRKVEFDQEQALLNAMKLFWKQGYDNTSMEDLVQHLGVNRFSIYNSLGDKRTLYLKALEVYDAKVFSQLVLPLKQEKKGKARLDDYLSNMQLQISGRGGKLGCMFQNTSAVNLGQDADIKSAVVEMTGRLLREIERALMDAQNEGECATDLVVRDAALHLLSAIQGLILMRKAGASERVVEAQIGFLRGMIRVW